MKNGSQTQCRDRSWRSPLQIAGQEIDIYGTLLVRNQCLVLQAPLKRNGVSTRLLAKMMHG